MNDPNHQSSDADLKFEAALRAFEPVAPSHNPFPTQHAPGIIPFPERRRSRAPLIALAAAAAIALAAALPLLLSRDPASTSSSVATATPLPAEAPAEITFDVEPIQQIGYIVDARPAPVIDVPGGTPLRPVRLRTVNTTLYKDNVTGSTITVGKPNDQILLVPVSFY